MLDFATESQIILMHQSGKLESVRVRRIALAGRSYFIAGVVSKEGQYIGLGDTRACVRHRRFTTHYNLQIQLIRMNLLSSIPVGQYLSSTD